MFCFDVLGDTGSRFSRSSRYPRLYTALFIMILFSLFLQFFIIKTIKRRMHIPGRVVVSRSVIAAAGRTTCPADLSVLKTSLSLNKGNSMSSIPSEIL